MGFSTNVAWWAFNLVNQYQDLNFKLINAEVRTKASQVEAKGQQLVVEWEREADAIAESSPTAALEMLTRRSNAFAEDVVADWWQFAWSLFAKYRGSRVPTWASPCGLHRGPSMVCPTRCHASERPLLPTRPSVLRFLQALWPWGVAMASRQRRIT